MGGGSVLGGVAAQTRQANTIASGVAMARYTGVITPAAAITTYGTGYLMAPDAVKAYFIPLGMAVQVSGMGAETLTLRPTFRMGDQSTVTGTTASIAANGNKQWFGFDGFLGNGQVGAGALPLIAVTWQVQSSIGNSQAKVFCDALMIEKSFGV